MDKIQILSEVQNIMRDVFDDERIVIDETTTANDVEGWDSLTHVQLVVTIEKHFKIKFNSQEILSWRDVGEMVNAIYSKAC